MTEDEMVGWRHQLNGREFEQALGDDEGQGSLACCSSWGHKEWNETEQDTLLYTTSCTFSLTSAGVRTDRTLCNDKNGFHPVC